MVRELRDMKQNLKETNACNTEMLRELKDMNQSLVRQIAHHSKALI